MSDRAMRCYKLAESLREEWADTMINALKENGHVYLDEAAYYKLKGDLMQLLIGRMPI